MISYYQDKAGAWHFRGTADPVPGPHCAQDCRIPDRGPFATLAGAIAEADELRGGTAGDGGLPVTWAILFIAVVGFILGMLEEWQYDSGRSLMVFGFLIAVVAGVDLIA